MIGKAKSIAHTGAAIGYGMDKPEAYELTRSGVVGESATEIKREFAMFQDLNSNCKNNTISAVLSPAIEDGQQLSDEQLRQVTEDYIEKMGLSDRQYTAYVHQEKAHKHIHLYVNRIDAQGGAYDDSFIGKRSQVAADEVAKEHGLVRARQVELSRDLSSQHSRKQIKEVHLEVMKTKPRDFEHYTKLMGEKGVKVMPSINKAGKMQGFKVGFNSQTLFKASKVWRGMTLTHIQPHFLLAKGLVKGLSKILGKGKDSGFDLGM